LIELDPKNPVVNKPYPNLKPAPVDLRAGCYKATNATGE
jgi:hypothetical protein